MYVLSLYACMGLNIEIIDRVEFNFLLSHQLVIHLIKSVRTRQEQTQPKQRIDLPNLYDSVSFKHQQGNINIL